MNTFFEQEIETFIEASGTKYELSSRYILNDSIASFRISIERENDNLYLDLSAFLIHKHSDTDKGILRRNHTIDVNKYMDCSCRICEYIDMLDELKICKKCKYDIQHENDLNYCKQCYLQSFFKCKYTHICSICLDPNNLDSCETSCGHFFHCQCLSKTVYYSYSNERYMISCPMCRTKQYIMFDSVNKMYVTVRECNSEYSTLPIE